MASVLKSVLQTRMVVQSLPKPQFLLPSFMAKTLASSTEAPKKPLSVCFEEAVGLRPTETSEVGDENNELKRKLLELERSLIDVKKLGPIKRNEKAKTAKAVMKPEKMEKKQSLYALFTGDKSDGQKGTEKKDDYREEQEEEIRVFKEFPLEMVLFAKLLYKEGYLNKANFLRGWDRLDMACFDEEYARIFLKSAAEKFGKDHQEIAKWLSGSDLKTIALFGCPSLDKKTVFAAKSLRKFFEIQEDTVCSKCVLKEQCKVPNKSVWGSNTRNLHLLDVMKVIIFYPLDLAHPKLQVPEEIHVSVSRLLNQLQSLSQTVSNRLT